MKRSATSHWRGTLQEGKGTLTTKSKALSEQPYSFKLRFKNEEGTQGTNPEELIAAAHAGCFNMALSNMLAEAGHEAEHLETKAEVKFEEKDGGFAITGILLHLNANVPGVSEDKFQELANKAKSGCPISKALSALPIEINASLK